MTALSCLAIGLAFLIAVGLLVFAGVLIGCALPRGPIFRSFSRSRKRLPRDPHAPGRAVEEGSAESRPNADRGVDPPETGG